MKVYLASPLFSLAEQNFNKLIAERIRKEFNNLELYLPQESQINDKSSFADSKIIANIDSNELIESDIIIAVLDGNSIDAGVSAEIGIFSTTDKPIFAIGTDIRTKGRENIDKYNAFVECPFELQWFYFNLFVVGLIKNSGGSISTTVDGLIEEIKKYISTLDKSL